MKGNPMPELIILGMCFIALVGAGFLYLKRETNDYTNIVDSVQSMSKRFDAFEKDIKELKMKGLDDVTDKRIKDLEEAKKHFQEFTPTVKVTVEKMPPVRVLVKHVQPQIPPPLPQPPGNLKKTPLLDKAGVTKKVQ